MAAGAIAKLLPGVDASPLVSGIRIQGIATDVRPGDQVKVKSGNTGWANGEIKGVHQSVSITMSPSPKVRFDDMIRIDVGNPHDTGAPVLTADNKLVGMVYAGAQSISWVMPITPVLRALGVELVQ
jgi:hypothetical protein